METFVNAYRSEMKKITSVRGNLILIGIFFLMSIAGAAAAIWAVNASEGMALFSTFGLANTGLQGIGGPLLIAFAALVVTAEYKTNAQQYTLMATPNRVVSAVAKFVAASLVAGAAMAIGCLINLVAFSMLGEPPASDTADFDTIMKAVPMYFLTGILLVAMSQGLGYMMRNTAGVVTILIILYSGLEAVFSVLPKINDTVGPYLPFGNMRILWSLSPTEDIGSLWMAFFVVLAWSAVLWIGGVITLKYRDA